MPDNHTKLVLDLLAEGYNPHDAAQLLMKAASLATRMMAETEREERRRDHLEFIDQILSRYEGP